MFMIKETLEYKQLKNVMHCIKNKKQKHSKEIPIYNTPNC